MKRQSGFTLIELVVVIVILGILAATAAPKFMNLQGDARISALNGLKGAVKSAVSMTYSKAILKGIEKEASDKVCASSSDLSATSCADEIDVVYGRPAASATGILKALDIEIPATPITSLENVDREKDWTFKVGEDGAIIIMGSSSTVALDSQTSGGGCNLSYKQSADASSAPTIKVNVDLC